MKTVLVSAPGVLLEEWSPEQLQVQTHPCLLLSAMIMADLQLNYGPSTCPCTFDLYSYWTTMCTHPTHPCLLSSAMMMADPQRD